MPSRSLQVSVGRKIFSASDKPLSGDCCSLHLDRVSKFTSPSHTLFCLPSDHHKQPYEAAWFSYFYFTETHLRSQATCPPWISDSLCFAAKHTHTHTHTHTQHLLVELVLTQILTGQQSKLAPTHLCSFTSISLGRLFKEIYSP